MYIGSKYDKNCNPDGFWVTYFTSSKKVHQLIEIYGVEDFTFSIRKTFNNPKSAYAYETKLLKKLNAAKRLDFLNQHNNDNSNVGWTKEKRKNAAALLSGKIWITNGKTDKKIQKNEIIPDGYKRGRTKGKNYGPRSKEFCEKMSFIKKNVPLSEKHKNSLKGIKRGMYGKKHSIETKEKISKARIGIIFSDEHKENLSKARKRNKFGPNKGRQFSIEWRKKLSESNKKRKKI